MFGLAIACRPHLGLVAVMATAVLGVRLVRKRQTAPLIAFLVPLLAAGLAIAIYNYQRFGNPFEFGVRYLMGNPMLRRTELAGRWVLPGLYYFVVCPPDFSPVFPWVHLAFRSPFYPDGYFLEPTAGCLFLAPFLIGLLFARLVRGAWAMVAAAAAILLFIAGTGFTTQRYEADFLPLAVLVSLAGIAAAIARSSGWQRRSLIAALVVLVTAGSLTGLALGISGPYDELLKDRPRSYARIAGWFSPVGRFRPRLNPPVDIAFTARLTPQPDGVREPLLAMGRRTYREIIMLEHHPGKFRLIAQSETTTAAQEIDDPGARPVQFRVTYRPETRKLAVAIDGREVLTHDLPALFTAPAQVTPGENSIAPEVSAPRFTGRLENVAGGIQ
jgi:hypothetical protein